MWHPNPSGSLHVGQCLCVFVSGGHHHHQRASDGPEEWVAWVVVRCWFGFIWAFLIIWITMCTSLGLTDVLGCMSLFMFVMFVFSGVCVCMCLCLVIPSVNKETHLLHRVPQSSTHVPCETTVSISWVVPFFEPSTLWLTMIVEFWSVLENTARAHRVYREHIGL